MAVVRKVIREKEKFFDDAADDWKIKFDDRKLNILHRSVEEFRSSLPAVNAPVLDIGCGTGVLFRFLEGLPFIALDISYKMLLQGRGVLPCCGLGLVQADAHYLPFLDGSCSGIIAFSAIPHLDRPEIFLSECRRTLVKGGMLSILHLHPAEEINAIHQSIGGAVANDFLREGNEMTQMLEREKFSVVKRETSDQYFFLARKH